MEESTFNSIDHNGSGWIRTYSGKKVYPLDLRESDICIEDIAHALSLQCRWSGHSKMHMSVAQHCLLVSHHSPPGEELWGLLHDASEAYLVDIPTPVKAQLALYQVAEKHAMNVISKYFGLVPFEPHGVKRADLLIRAAEARDLMPAASLVDFANLPKPHSVPMIVPMQPHAAEVAYLRRYRQLLKTHKPYDGPRSTMSDLFAEDTGKLSITNILEGRPGDGMQYKPGMH